MSNKLTTIDGLRRHLDSLPSYRQEQRSFERWRIVPIVQALISAPAVGLVGAVATATVYPSMPLWVLLGIAGGGFLIKIIMYLRGNEHSFKIFKDTGVMEDVKQRIYTRELVQREYLAFIKHKLKEQDADEEPNQSNTQFLKQFKKDKKDEAGFKAKYGLTPKEFKHAWRQRRKQAKQHIALCFDARKHWRKSKESDSNLTNPALESFVKIFEQQLKTIRHSQSQDTGDASDTLWSNWLRFYHNINNELLIKSLLAVVAGVFAIANGIGFGSLMFMHLKILFASVISVAWLPPVLACVIGVCVGVMFWMLMYRTLNKALVNNVLWHKILKPFTRLFHFKESEYQKGLVLAICKKLLTALFIAALIALSVLVNFASSGTWLKSTVDFLSWLGSLGHGLGFIAANSHWLSAIVVLVMMLPVAILFSFENGFETATKVGVAMGDLFKKLWSKRQGSSKQSASESIPWWKMAAKYSLLAIVAVVLVAAFALHVFGEGGVSGEGVNDKEDMFVGIFETITQFIDKIFSISITPATLAVLASVVVETGEDGTFTFHCCERAKEKIEYHFGQKQEQRKPINQYNSLFVGNENSSELESIQQQGNQLADLSEEVAVDLSI